MTRLIAPTAAIVLSLFAVNAHAVPVPWPTSQGGNGHSYEAVQAPEGISWTDANAAATAAGGHLATITSDAENTFVFNLIDNAAFWFAESPPTSNSGIGPWLGGFQPPGSQEPAGNWQWVTGEPFVFTNWETQTPGGEPNNTFLTGGPEDALQFFSHQSRGTLTNPTWNDYPSSALVRGYIIEYDAAVAVPEPATLVLALVGLLCAGFVARKRIILVKSTLPIVIFLLCLPPSIAREWNSKDGRAVIDAEITGLTIKLKKKDGKTITVPLEKLSEKDVRFIATWIEDTLGETKQLKKKPEPTGARIKGKAGDGSDLAALLKSTEEKLEALATDAPTDLTLPGAFEAIRKQFNEQANQHDVKTTLLINDAILSSGGAFPAGDLILDLSPPTGIRADVIEGVPHSSFGRIPTMSIRALRKISCNEVRDMREKIKQKSLLAITGKAILSADGTEPGRTVCQVYYRHETKTTLQNKLVGTVIIIDPKYNVVSP